MTALIQDLQRTLPAAGRQYNLAVPSNVNISFAVNNNGANVSVTLRFLQQPGGLSQMFTVGPYNNQNFINIRGLISIILDGNGANISIVVTIFPEEITIQPVRLQDLRTPFASIALVAVPDFLRAPAAATNRVIYRIRNTSVEPIGVGTNVMISYLGILCNAARNFIIGQITVGTSDRTTVLGGDPKTGATGLGTVARTSVDANVTTDLATPIHQEVLQANVIREYREAIKVRPGEFIDIQIGDASDATTDRMTFNLEMYDFAPGPS